ncbi:hypothetical protein PAXRUDRAFT_825845 [Paxillus rubicundulus Ve08.2h10]|uniref:BHLH domain-containing protein n=1 Tax=Paxillus rubicundulus Ve08.2h10 TaxID=930991 RepID=A0A0D0DSN0_9AGAM|nr:hypothetical protein PAXRUDRAFT_825845 [Paxillus rubicundulus Ve08.2h10]
MQQPSYPGDGLPAPRPGKADLQRAYRSKEVESFNLLRDVIKDITGEEIQTRNEILRKAIDLLQHPDFRARNSSQHHAMGAVGHPRSHRLDPPSPPVASGSWYGMGIAPQQDGMAGRHPPPAGGSHRNTVSTPHIGISTTSSQWSRLGNCEYDPPGFLPTGATSSYDHGYDAGESSMPEIDALCQDLDHQSITGHYRYHPGGRSN